LKKKMSESDSVSESGSFNEIDDAAFQEDLRALTGTSNKALIINEAGINQKLESFSCTNGLDWIEMQTVTGEEEHEPETVDDDLQREFSFYTRALQSATIAEEHLQAASVPYIRPDDYFAEMLKSDKHMLKVKAQLLKNKQKIESSENAKRQRELKKLGKQVQVERTKEKAMKKNAQLATVKKWRTQRKQGNADDFDVALLDEAARLDGKGKRPAPNARRQLKNKKFGSGPVKRNKHNTVESTMSMKSFSQRRNNTLFHSSGGGGSQPRGKRKAGKSAANRPGKRSRQQQKNKR